VPKNSCSPRRLLVLSGEMPMLMDIFLEHLLRIELQDLGGVMVDEGNGAVEGHRGTLVR